MQYVPPTSNTCAFHVQSDQLLHLDAPVKIIKFQNDLL